ncbi:substrate-binding domain-containing protein [Allokutzneria albata]|uniref:Monosaccharide ABC transporter substrate-binding protein, CUT2 family n=1 Tax=Allokutzneria albata TaxID=211114 RepID=A0A1G9ZVK7_ALLAB|nr:substrate-binding domain-containing protein [Allokutzneria albata]SDN25175.1 monosaccharide ABC transporter substrate-binding protein, CUT2 family [Allokutzneria albata]
MKLTRRSAFAAVAVATLALTAACGGASGGSGGTGGEITVALSVSTLNNPFFVQLRDGAQDAAKALGVKLVVQDAQNDPATQVNQVQTFTTQGVKAIIVNAVESDQATPAAKAAENAKIPVIAVDRAVNNAKIASQIASDNVAGGKLAAEALAKAIGGSGDVVVLQGTPGTSAARDRGQGFTDGIKASPGVKVAAQQAADFDRSKGLEVTTSLLPTQSALKGLFAQNDEMALGAIKALSGRDVKVVGFDATEDGLAAIQAGTMAATIAQQPRELGRLAVEQAVKAAKGEQVTAKVDVPVKVVTKENLAEFTK